MLRIVGITNDDHLRETAISIAGSSVVVEWANSADSVLALLGLEPAAALLLDLRDRRRFGGIVLIKEVLRILPNLPQIILTDLTQERETLRTTFQMEAVHPADQQKIAGEIIDALTFAKLCERLEEVQHRLVERFSSPALLGDSPAMEEIYQLIESLRDTRATVLIQGESGSGKELAARLLHSVSACRKGPFVAINCGAMVETLLESELFGYERGAFTGAAKTKIGLFETANNGTLFLDEIGELPLTLQVKILRAIETQRFYRVGGTTEIATSARLLAATNADLAGMVASGKFRQDLFWRLNVVPLELPSLVERGDDLPLLFTNFFLQSRQNHKRAIWGVRNEVWNHISNHRWSGNVRELINRVERVVLLTKSRWITTTDFPDLQPVGTSPIDARSLEEIERESVRKAVANCGGNVSQAARQLGISRTTVYKRLAELKEENLPGEEN